MPRLYDNGCFWSVSVSADETYDWAHRPGSSWPCSTLSGSRFWAQFDKRNGDLVDLTVNGRGGDALDRVDAHELNAILDDLAIPRAKARGFITE